MKRAKETISLAQAKDAVYEKVNEFREESGLRVE